MLGNGWTSVSPVEVYVQRACEPSLHEANYAVHLELAEHINAKKANTPRDAAMAVVRMINHRNPHVAMLALGLLDSLVQACGYAFHLQIATKEFLNELVRRFPERPPPFPGPVMARILETIHGWKTGICAESRWKEDLGNIRDMHKLLTFKGYRFRDMAVQAALPSGSSLKSPEELEADDREAQAAKLQELIRRGGPKDLMAAQELMKIMAGANPEAKPDYRAQTLAEVDKLQSKVILLNEMLDNVDTARGEKFASGDAYHQVSVILTQARPKIQKWISNAETEDPESLETYLQMNDQINAVLTRYEAYKKGDYSIQAVPPELAQGASGGGPTGKSLIDFMDDEPTVPGAPQSAAHELADLFASPAASQSTPTHPGAQDPRANIMAAFSSTPGAIALPGTPTPQQQQQAPVQQQQWNAAQAAIWGPNAAQTQQKPQWGQAGIVWGQTSTVGASASRSTPPPQWSSAPVPGPTMSSPRAWGGMPTSPPPQQQQQPQQQTQQTQKDPFADLEGLF